MNGMIKIIADVFNKGRPQVISAFYEALGESRGSSTLNMKTKRDSEINTEIVHEECDNVCI